MKEGKKEEERKKRKMKGNKRQLKVGNKKKYGRKEERDEVWQE